MQACTVPVLRFCPGSAVMLGLQSMGQTGEHAEATCTCQACHCHAGCGGLRLDLPPERPHHPGAQGPQP